jgi:DNA-binding transcriptional LysR family regulator
MATGADRLLARLGVRPRVAVVSNEWLSLPWLIRETDLVTLLPRRVASWWADRSGFVLREIPGGDSGRFTETMFWHPTRAGDDGLAWLREQILAAVPQV